MSHKSIIEFNNKLWGRKDIPDLFDITMGHGFSGDN